MALTDRQQEGLSKLLDRLGNSLLAIIDRLDRLDNGGAAAHDKILAQGSALMTELKLLRQALDEARHDVEKIRDNTPVHPVPLHIEKEKSSGVAIGPVKMSSKDAAKIGRNLPWIAFGVLLALILVVLSVIAIVKASGVHLTGDEPGAGAPAESEHGTTGK